MAVTDHDEIRGMLALAASGDLDAAEENRVAAHVARCGDCAAELERWRTVVGELRRLPTPQPSAGAIARARAAAQAELAVQAEQRADQVNLVFLLLFAWALTLSGWLIVRLLTGGLAGWLELLGARVWTWMAGYALLGWLASSLIAVILLGQQHRNARRMV